MQTRQMLLNLCNEKCELTYKIDKIDSFLRTRANSIDTEQVSLLEAQLRAMREYQFILNKRINLLRKTEEFECSCGDADSVFK